MEPLNLLPEAPDPCPGAPTRDETCSENRALKRAFGIGIAIAIAIENQDVKADTDGDSDTDTDTDRTSWWFSCVTGCARGALATGGKCVPAIYAFA